ncbi:Gfo/Idh/MocA family protein [Kitasatospora sp. NBC_01266]|uniref:Gfo/Idh/MocA family protein n=1 Tax=Kitasatospora sp. NBC_01266 TaxID=2903572 RepID=UPI002E346E03|nr:Gfo/Idh/MocA family oxidoreductase [Kitasatospora sp. NBC_01266]
MPGSALRIALLGTAHIHLADHLTVLAAQRGAAAGAGLCAVHHGRSPGEGRLAGAVAEALRGVPVAPSAAEALAGADAALVCSTTAEHGPLLAAIAAAGLPALVEKPLATTGAATAALLRLTGRTANPAVPAMFLRRAPSLRRARTLLTAGRIGELRFAEAWFCHGGLPAGSFTGTAAWMLDPRRGGTGAFADLGIHLLDLLRWLRPRAAITVHAARLRPLRGGRVGLDEGGTAELDWGGVPVALRTDWAAAPGGPAGGVGIGLRLRGSRGSVTVRGGSLLLATAHGVHAERHAEPAAGHALSAFLASLRGRTCWQAPTARDILASAHALDRIAEVAGVQAGAGH